MAKSARRSAKGKSPAISPVSRSGASTPSSQSGPIPPFTYAPSSLSPIIPLLSPNEVYLIHIDTTDPELKKTTFITPLVMNMFIIAFLAFRIYSVRSTYPALIATVLGFESSMNVDVASITWTEMATLILRRALPIIFDYFLFMTFLPWPIRFYRGPGQLRRKIGYQNNEIIVRRSQPSLSQTLERNRWITEDEGMRDKIVAAVTPDRLRKTGYLLNDQYWDLDYAVMIKAHELLDNTTGSKDSKSIPLSEFRTAVLVNTDTDGWLIWHVGDEDTEEGRVRTKQRDQILAFKEKLSDMGHEALFFRWVELIQYESTQTGGFTAERQQSAMIQAKAMFEAAGVDFTQFWQEVGGMEGFGPLDGEGEVEKWQGEDQLD